MKSAAENSRDNKPSPSRFVLLGASTAFALLGAANVANAKDAVATTIVGVNGDGFPALEATRGAHPSRRGCDYI